MLAGLGSASTNRHAASRLDDLAAEQSLGVVAQDHGVASRRVRRARTAPSRRAIARPQRRRRFPICAHDLLAVRDDARLARRRTVRGGEYARVVDLLAAQQLAHVVSANASSPIVPGEDDVGVQRPQIIGDVTGPAERKRVIRYGDDRNGCLGRDRA